MKFSVDLLEVTAYGFGAMQDHTGVAFAKFGVEV